MSTLQEKLIEAETNYQEGVQKFQRLQHDLIAQEGAIDTLRALIKEQEQDNG